MSMHEAFEYQPEMHEVFEFEQPELHESYETGHETGELHEAMELELAQELMEITSEAELEEFLGKLVRGVARGASAFMRSSVGKAVGGVLRNVAKTALPMVGSALGSFVAPGLGTAIGGKLGGMAANLLEAEEREMMGEAEAELEAARRYVRWANGTVRNAMRAPYGVPPRAVARSAAVSSARRYAPTLLRPAYGRRRGSQWRSRRPQYWSSTPWVGTQAAWDPAPARQAPTCSCGQNGGGQGGSNGYDAGGGFEPFDGDESQESESYESYETHESQETGVPAGRWYRRGNRIVLVGA